MSSELHVLYYTPLAELNYALLINILDCSSVAQSHSCPQKVYSWPIVKLRAGLPRVFRLLRDT